ncbi:MAG: hypothetical protein MJ102_00750 [Clostridia bacterium]|nr:hypothetical protein [Clostridia bacterium]
MQYRNISELNIEADIDMSDEVKTFGSDSDSTLADLGTDPALGGAVMLIDGKEVFPSYYAGNSENLSYRIYKDDLVLFDTDGKKYRVLGSRAGKGRWRAGSTVEFFPDYSQISSDILARTGVGTVIIPLTLDDSQKRNSDQVNENIWSEYFPSRLFRPGKTLVDKSYIHKLAELGGSDVDVVSFFLPGNSSSNLDDGFCALAFIVISLLFRRIALRRGFNFRTDTYKYVPYFSFNGLIYETDRKETGPEYIPELCALYECAAKCGVALKAAFFEDKSSDHPGLRLAVRFCPLRNPYGFDGKFNEVDTPERRRYVERRKVVLDEIPLDFSGKF